MLKLDLDAYHKWCMKHDTVDCVLTSRRRGSHFPDPGAFLVVWIEVVLARSWHTWLLHQLRALDLGFWRRLTGPCGAYQRGHWLCQV